MDIDIIVKRIEAKITNKPKARIKTVRITNNNSFALVHKSGTTVLILNEAWWALTAGEKKELYTRVTGKEVVGTLQAMDRCRCMLHGYIYDQVKEPFDFINAWPLLIPAGILITTALISIL